MDKLYLGTKDRNILGPIGKISNDIFENMSHTKYDFLDPKKFEEKIYFDVLPKALTHSDLADSLSYSVPQYKVVVTTKKIQNRTHHKKRINKKWAKRYGYTYYEIQTDDIMYATADSTIYCTLKGFETIKKSIGGTSNVSN